MAVVSGGTENVLGEVLSPPNTLPAQAGLRVSEGVSGGTVDRHVNPTYPPEARQQNIEGRVVLQALVTERGAVQNLKIVSGNQLLARAAMDAVAQWHYQPFRLNGQPIRMTTNIILIFKLR
jgi:TonB family protein